MAQPVQEEIVLELRQLNTNSEQVFDISNNAIGGDYKTILPTSLTLNAGDELTLKSVFVDSVEANANKIHIGIDETQLTITNGLYLLDWGFANSASNYQVERNHFDTTTIPNGKSYYLSEPNVVAATMVEVFEFRLYQNADNWKSSDDVALHFSYTDNNNNRRNIDFAISKTLINPKISAGGAFVVNHGLHASHNGTAVSPFPILIKQGTLTKSDSSKNADKMAASGVKLDPGSGSGSVEVTEETAIPADGKKIFEPKTFTTTITLEEGDYEPSELADLISEKMSAVKDAGTDYITGDYSDSNFLKTSQGLKTANGGSHVDFVASDASDVITFASAKDYWVGTSQIGLIYDEGLGKFAFQRLHSTLFSEGGLPIIKSITSGGNKFFANKTGGVYFTDLQPSSLWKDKLGFDIDQHSTTSILSNKKDKAVKTIGSISNGTFYKMPLEDGLTVTGEDMTLDSLIIKKVDATNSLFFDIPPAAFSGVETTGSTPISCFAKTAINNSNTIHNIPYYQIELDLGIVNKKIGSDRINNKISGIISRFYDSDSYSSSMDGSGGFQYIHSGAPVQLSAIGVRVLNPEGSLATIGTDNSVFLSIIKPK